MYMSRGFTARSCGSKRNDNKFSFNCFEAQKNKAIIFKLKLTWILDVVIVTLFKFLSIICLAFEKYFYPPAE